MKTVKYLIFATLMALIAVSCAKADKEPIHTNNFIIDIQISPSNIVAPPTAGKIDNDTGKIFFPITKKNRPKYDDLTKLSVSATINFDAVITPSLTGLKDLSEPFQITVTAGDGNVREYTLQAYYSLAE